LNKIKIIIKIIISYKNKTIKFLSELIKNFNNISKNVRRSCAQVLSELLGEISRDRTKVGGDRYVIIKWMGE
jgi:hypothetical protein